MKSGEAPGTACNWLDALILGCLLAVSGAAEGIQIRATVCCHVFRIGCSLAMGMHAVKGRTNKGLGKADVIAA